MTTCPTCGAETPETARYCHRCGTDERTADGDSRRVSSYAVQPGEPVVSFNLVSSLMPMASGSVPETYKIALGLGVAIPVVAAMLGFLAFAFAAAAFVVPTAYMLYIYDVNEWEDQPIPVVVGAVAAAAVLGGAFTYVWREVLLDAPVLMSKGADPSIDGSRLLVLGLVVPVVAVLLAQIGPVLLARMPLFDDLIDGLTFGVASGATFAAVETLVVNSDLFTSASGRIDNPDAALWAALVLTAAIVKPVIYGAAIGIAVAAFSGVGEGPGRFSSHHVRATVEAMVALAAYQIAIEVLDVYVDGTGGILLGLVAGLVIAAVLILRLRFVLHLAVIEAAMEAAARGSVPKSANQGIGFCPACGMPLLHEASFCSACGTAVRAAGKAARRELAAPGADVEA